LLKKTQQEGDPAFLEALKIPGMQKGEAAEKKNSIRIKVGPIHLITGRERADEKNLGSATMEGNPSPSLGDG